MSYRILICSNVHWWNAEAAYAAQIASLLQRAGHQVSVLTLPNTANHQQLLRLNLPLLTDIDLNSFNPWKLLKTWRKLRHFIRSEGIQIIHAHRSEGFIFLALLRKFNPSLRLLRTRGTTRAVKNNFFNRWLYRQATDAVIFAGKIVQDRLEQEFPLISQNSKVIYYPASIVSFPFSREHYAQEFNFPLDHKIIAIVGRTSPVKGHVLLLEALKMILQNFTKVTLLILYKDANPNRLDLVKLVELSHSLNIFHAVRFIGPRTDLMPILASIDLGIVSSLDSEVICRVAMEFFSVGTPVLAFPTGCLPEIIENNVSGEICKAKTAESLAQSTVKLLRNSERMLHLRKGALAAAQSRFHPQRFVEQTLEIYQCALKQK